MTQSNKEKLKGNLTRLDAMYKYEREKDIPGTWAWEWAQVFKPLKGLLKAEMDKALNLPGPFDRLVERLPKFLNPFGK